MGPAVAIAISAFAGAEIANPTAIAAVNMDGIRLFIANSFVARAGRGTYQKVSTHCNKVGGGSNSPGESPLSARPPSKQAIALIEPGVLANHAGCPR